MPKKSDTTSWEIEFQNLIREAEVLDKEDASIYVSLLKHRKPVTGSQLSVMFPHLKRTHIYSILNRLQEYDMVEIINPGKRPAKYRAIEPLHTFEMMIRKEESHLNALQTLYNYTKNEVIPRLSDSSIFGGRVSNTFVIPDRHEFINEISREIEHAEFRVLGLVTQELFKEVKEVLLKATKRIQKKHFSEGQPMTWEYQRDHHSFTIVTANPEFNLEDDYQSSLVFHEPPIETEIIIIDNTTYISNMDTNLGLALKIADESVTEVYHVVLINTYLNAAFRSQSSDNLSDIGKYVGSNRRIRKMVKSLLKQGWRISRENSDNEGFETGIVAPTLGFGLFGLGGIIFYPFEKSGEDVLQERYTGFIEASDYYIESFKRQFEVTRKQKKKKIDSHKALVLEVTIKAKEQWKPVLSNVPAEILSSKGLTGPAIIGFNLKDEGAFLIWSINPNNVKTMLDTFLKVK